MKILNKNILSLNSIEELLSLVYRILKHNINKIDNISDLYDLLQKSTSGKIFDALIVKIDIKEFFNMILIFKSLCIKFLF